MQLENGIYLHYQSSALCLSHVEDDQLIEAMYIPEGIQPGDVLVGRVAHKVSSSQYFVEIGLSKPALLQKPLTEYREGDKILVQLKRLMIPEGNLVKNAEVTDRLQLSAVYLRFAPAGNDVVIAGAIQDKAWRQEAKLDLEAHLSHFSYGSVIVYKNAYNVSFPELAKELTDLKECHEELLKQFPKAKPGTILRTEAPFYVNYLLQHENSPVFVTDAALPQRLESYGVRQNRIAFDPRHHFLIPLATLWSESLAETISLNQGGFLIIEEGKTLTAIDVNTSAKDNHSGAVRVRSDSELLEFAKAALNEALRQIYLRKIGGIIMIDLPRFNQAKYQKSVLSEAKKYEGSDLQIMGFTKAGLLEITKRRTQASLKQMQI